MRVKKVCENCGKEFEGAPQARFHSNACRVAFARAQERGLAADALPERQLDEPGPPSGTRPLDVLLALPQTAVLTDAEEQVIRDHFGFGASERRTRAERFETAARIMQASPPTPERVVKAIEQLADEERRHRARQKAYQEAQSPKA